jgi:hypothetical protein
MVEVGRYLWEGERNRWEISKGVVAKSSKKYLVHSCTGKIISKFLVLSRVKNTILLSC